MQYIIFKHIYIYLVFFLFYYGFGTIQDEEEWPKVANCFKQTGKFYKTESKISIYITLKVIAKINSFDLKLNSHLHTWKKFIST